MPFMDMVGTDMLNFGSELQIHLAMAAQISAPASVSPDYAVEAAKAMLKNEAVKLDIEVDEAVHRAYANMEGIELQPMSAFLGGVVAQEVVKVTGKFIPVPGWFHFHSMETLPDELDGDRPTVEEADKSRYGDLMMVFGRNFPEKLQNEKLFMVGCGALGCELLKNFALNGVCCGPNGMLTVTDADRIELSNLARQFLFREHNVGHANSVAACAMARQMNSGLKVNAQEMFVGPNTEDTFNDDFWMGLDGVVNALDNMEARLYVDKMCVKYEKSLSESGTMGPSGNVDPVVPFKTKTYKDGGEAVAGGGIPMCTLRNFPHLPDHCIEWARDLFEASFVQLPKKWSGGQPAASLPDECYVEFSEDIVGMDGIRMRLRFMRFVLVRKKGDI